MKNSLISMISGKNYHPFSNSVLMALMKSMEFSTVTSLRLVISAKSLVILPDSMVLNVALSSLSAKAHKSFNPSSSPRFLNAPVHAKMVATELVEVSSPFRYL